MSSRASSPPPLSVSPPPHSYASIASSSHSTLNTHTMRRSSSLNAPTNPMESFNLRRLRSNLPFPPTMKSTLRNTRGHSGMLLWTSGAELSDVIVRVFCRQKAEVKVSSPSTTPDICAKETGRLVAELKLHSTILKQSEYFADRLSNRWTSTNNLISKDSVVINFPVLETQLDADAFVSTMELLYTHAFSEKLKSRSTAIRILKICNEILWSTGIEECCRFIAQQTSKDYSQENANRRVISKRETIKVVKALEEVYPMCDFQGVESWFDSGYVDGNFLGLEELTKLLLKCSEKGGEAYSEFIALEFSENKTLNLATTNGAALILAFQNLEHFEFSLSKFVEKSVRLFHWADSVDLNYHITILDSWINKCWDLLTADNEDASVNEIPTEMYFQTFARSQESSLELETETDDDDKVFQLIPGAISPILPSSSNADEIDPERFEDADETPFQESPKPALTARKGKAPLLFSHLNPGKPIRDDSIQTGTTLFEDLNQPTPSSLSTASITGTCPSPATVERLRSRSSLTLCFSVVLRLLSGLARSKILDSLLDPDTPVSSQELDKINGEDNDDEDEENSDIQDVEDGQNRSVHFRTPRSTVVPPIIRRTRSLSSNSSRVVRFATTRRPEEAAEVDLAWEIEERRRRRRDPNGTESSQDEAGGRRRHVVVFDDEEIIPAESVSDDDGFDTPDESEASDSGVDHLARVTGSLPSVISNSTPEYTPDILEFQHQYQLPKSSRIIINMIVCLWQVMKVVRFNTAQNDIDVLVAAIMRNISCMRFKRFFGAWLLVHSDLVLGVWTRAAIADSMRMEKWRVKKR